MENTLVAKMIGELMIVSEKWPLSFMIDWALVQTLRFCPDFARYGRK